MQDIFLEIYKEKIWNRFFQMYKEEAIDKGLKKHEFCKIIHIKQAHLDNILNKDQYISLDIIIKLQLFLHISYQWMIWGTGRSRKVLKLPKE